MLHVIYRIFSVFEYLPCNMGKKLRTLEFNSRFEQSTRRDFNSNLLPNNERCFHKACVTNSRCTFFFSVEATKHSVHESCLLELAFKSTWVEEYSRRVGGSCYTALKSGLQYRGL